MPRKKKSDEPITAKRVEHDEKLGWVCICSDGGRRKATSENVVVGKVELVFDHTEDTFRYTIALPLEMLVEGYEVP